MSEGNKDQVSASSSSPSSSSTSATTTTSATTGGGGGGGKKQQNLQRIQEMTEEHREEIKKSFEAISKDGKTIETSELKFAMRALGFEPKKEEIKKLLETSLDRNSTGKIEFEDFLLVMAQKFEEKGARDEILKAFNLFDADGTGRITFENLKAVAEELGEKIDDQELREMIAEADRDGDGGVDREEFLKIMKKTCLY